MQEKIKNPKWQRMIFNKRLLCLIFIIIVCLLVLMIRLFNLQITNHQHFMTLSSSNRLRIEMIPPIRGLIYDKSHTLLAQNIPRYDLIFQVNRVNLDSLLLISNLLKTTKKQQQSWLKMARKARKNKNLVLKKNLSKQERAIIYVNLFHLPGIRLNKTFSRYYPFDAITTTALGMIRQAKTDTNLQSIKSFASNKNLTTGLSGIEGFYNTILTGQPGHKEVEVNAKNHWLRTTSITPATNGSDLILTLNIELQKKVSQAFSNKSGAAVVINPNNGEILALGSFPSYSANAFYSKNIKKKLKQWHKNPENPLFNRVSFGLFPPASTIKPILALMGLHSNTINLQDKIYDLGFFQIEGTKHIFRDHKGHSHQWINLQHAIAVSCDTYFYQLAIKLGINNINTILSQFGFGTISATDIKTTSGIINSPKWKRDHKRGAWYTGDTVISGIGQGNTSATPLQLAHMASLIAMRGKGFKPHLAKAIVDKNNITTAMPIEAWQMMSIDKKNYADIIKAMQMVISGPYKHNTGWRFGKSKYTVAGKTGTAELYHRKTDNVSNIPRRLRDHALFIGFAPVDKPQVAIAVLIEHEPTAVAVARKIFDAFFKLDGK